MGAPVPPAGEQPMRDITSSAVLDIDSVTGVTAKSSLEDVVNTAAAVDLPLRCFHEDRMYPYGQRNRPE
jgi:hypothetical protein